MGKVTLEFRQGDTFNDFLVFTDSSDVIIDLSNYLARMKAKKNDKDSTTVIDINDSGSAGNRLVIDGAAGKVTFDLSPTTTAAIAAGTYKYDLEIEELTTGAVDTLIFGVLSVAPEVTF